MGTGLYERGLRLNVIPKRNQKTFFVILSVAKNLSF